MNVLTDINRNNSTKKSVILSGNNDKSSKEQNSISLSNFNFLTVQELLKDCKTSLSDDLIEERNKLSIF